MKPRVSILSPDFKHVPAVCTDVVEPCAYSARAAPARRTAAPIRCGGRGYRSGGQKRRVIKLEAMRSSIPRLERRCNRQARRRHHRNRGFRDRPSCQLRLAHSAVLARGGSSSELESIRIRLSTLI